MKQHLNRNLIKRERNIYLSGGEVSRLTSCRRLISHFDDSFSEVHEIYKDDTRVAACLKPFIAGYPRHNNLLSIIPFPNDMRKPYSRSVK